MPENNIDEKDKNINPEDVADVDNDNDSREGEEKNLEDMDTAELVEEVEKLKKLLSEGDDRYLRLVAEYDNYRKRTTKEKDSIYPAATADTIGKFLPVLDNFERALEYDCSSEEFTKGIELIHQSFNETITALGVEPIGEVGEEFDPEIHNAVMHIEDPELGENKVSMVMQKGYKLGDRVIRHAMVQTAN